MSQSYLVLKLVHRYPRNFGSCYYAVFPIRDTDKLIFPPTINVDYDIDWEFCKNKKKMMRVTHDLIISQWKIMYVNYIYGQGKLEIRDFPVVPKTNNNISTRFMI